MDNKHDEIKHLLKNSRKLLSNKTIVEDIKNIRSKYNILNEQIDLTDDNVLKKQDISMNVDDSIIDDTEKMEDRKQGYRISGGILVLHGKDKMDLELTTDEKLAFQETMDEFIEEVSDLVDFNKLNVYPSNVEWSGKIIDFDLEFFYTIGEENGIYINGEMTKADDEFIELLTNLKKNYEKFKSRWSKILSSRKKTK